MQIKFREFEFRDMLCNENVICSKKKHENLTKGLTLLFLFLLQKDARDI